MNKCELNDGERPHYLRGFVWNSRHPDPRRAWKGGPEPRLLTPDPLDPLDPADPAMSSKSAKSDGVLVVFMKTGAPVRCFFDFFIPLSSKTQRFESFFGRLPAVNAFKTRCFS